MARRLPPSPRAASSGPSGDDALRAAALQAVMDWERGGCLVSEWSAVAAAFLRQHDDPDAGSALGEAFRLRRRARLLADPIGDTYSSPRTPRR